MASPPAAPPPSRFRLLPRDEMQGWLPYVWLIYLPPFLYAPYQTGSAWQWAATVGGMAVFLGAYFRAYWVTGRGVLPLIGVQVALALAFAPWNPAAPTFLIYAASFAARVGPRRDAVRIIVAIMALGAATAGLLRAPAWFWIAALVFTPLVGWINLHAAGIARTNARLRMAQEEVRHLAAVAERERIARDLHDVLGHTLSLIILKSELARRVAGRDPERAAREIGDVEQVARKALAEVREAIRGYRGTLDDEAARARALLEAAGIRAELDVAPPALDRAREEALALALREAVTNTVRHSGATWCRVRVSGDAGGCTLAVSDDGRGGIRGEGHGLRGMRERVEALGGRVAWSSARGTTLTATVPAGAPAPAAGPALAGRVA
jgi:two-component system sensor histidine kinase DesK